MPLATPTRHSSAAHQPSWPKQHLVDEVRHRLETAHSLVTAEEVEELRVCMATVASGQATVVQLGDCAEPFIELSPEAIDRKLRFINDAADLVAGATGQAVIAVGRIAGQFAKPRSNPTETVAGQQMSTYMGDAVNGPRPTPEERQPDPLRLLRGHRLAQRATETIRQYNSTTAGRKVWTSHEALLMDYEHPQVRVEGTARYLTSTHWPWIGNRTRHLDGAHISLMAAIRNPVSCKIGPGVFPSEAKQLVRILNPGNEMGRLSLIARFGHSRIKNEFPAVVSAICNAGLEVTWMVDPLHGNTRNADDGAKARLLPDVLGEVNDFNKILRTFGLHSAGIHLEATGDYGIEECTTRIDSRRAPDSYRSLCDPRLNRTQTAEVLTAWTEGR
ncbi:3-deoxy-D-arabinoheptulosonate-7-phosphate synthase [Brevibacterium iodinum ATCC 49514]|uniref:Phospho-2-dehydro-3-deoxyheptonate aldolase n=2 Tax=Brevibacterium iodinum TaxID=31943 RepID=A0A2H1KKW4_9MICO|nr:3-deoxy-7-phosphoheptulonate synthase [Brevibacterium iodinum]SMY00361.1 3-deoxy-D-arabinoheptulosonate-7-phosphate synthase [Brevibacterium iodinum ATCC 49514]SUW70205.1 Phospho-2-dehydro-3-deoxyheptonate aldolase [Brevibacterium iodinum]